MKIYYNVESNCIDLADIYDTKALKSSGWINNFPIFLHNIKNIKDWWYKKSAENEPHPSCSVSVRACPGIRDLLNKTVVVKLPTDMIVVTHADGSYDWMVSDNIHVPRFDNPTTASYQVLGHSREQWDLESANIEHPSENNIFKDRINVKFLLPVTLASDKVSEWLITKPTYHNNTPFDVIQGIVKIRKVNTNYPVNVMFPKEENFYHFKAGTPIAYMVSMNDSKIDFVPMGDRKFPRSYKVRFLGS